MGPYPDPGSERDTPPSNNPPSNDTPSNNTPSNNTPSTSTTSSNTGPSGPTDAARMAMARLAASFREVLRRWGIKPDKNLLNLVERAVRGQWSTTQFIDRLRLTPEYRQTFQGLRWRTGMTEGQYLSTYSQYKARAQDIGEKLSRKEFGILLKHGLSFDEYSARVDALNAIDTYAPLWGQFQQALEIRGVAVPGQKLTKKELSRFIMGMGPKKWEAVWQETYLTTQLERVAGVEITAKQAGETATPDTYGMTRQDLLSVIKQVEALNPGFEVESLSGQQFAEIGTRIREYSINYLQRYGLTTKDLLEMELGGPRAAIIAERAQRILKTQEAFQEPRAIPQSAMQVGQVGVQREELPQSQ